MKALYSLKDNVKQEFLPPFVANTDGEALRVKHQAISKDQWAATHADEYSVWFLADWDEYTGEITVLETPSELTETIQNAKEELEIK